MSWTHLEAALTTCLTFLAPKRTECNVFLTPKDSQHQVCQKASNFHLLVSLDRCGGAVEQLELRCYFSSYTPFQASNCTYIKGVRTIPLGH